MAPKCGKKQSNSSKAWTLESINDHECQCSKCLKMSKVSSIAYFGAKTFKDKDGREYALCLPDKDEQHHTPDGAYWAMRMEGYYA